MTESRAGALLKVGDVLPEHICGPITRTTLALFAGASGDHNPMHIDIDFARRSGAPDVFAHGMLSMAYLAQMLTRWAPQEALRSWNARFLAVTPVGSKIICHGEVVEITHLEGTKCARLKIGARIEGGPETMAGEAVVALG